LAVTNLSRNDWKLTGEPLLIHATVLL
jgi:hypothetical protein